MCLGVYLQVYYDLGEYVLGNICLHIKGHITSTNSTVELGLVGTSWCMFHRLTTQFLLHSNLIPDSLVGFTTPYSSTVELGWVMCHGLKCPGSTCPW